jgi:hypothetical protein
MADKQTQTDDLEFKVFPDLQKKTDLELEEIVLRGVNIHIPESQASRAKRLLDLRRARASAAPKDPVQQQISIGNLYGQFAGINNGTMIQNNNQDVMEALNALTKVVSESELDEEKKQDVLGDIQTIQAQVTKKNPDRNILEATYNGLQSGLQAITNAAVLTSIVVPNMDKIQTFIHSLPIPGIK